MARLPTVGGDGGNWGTILNQFLEVSHNADGTIIDNAVSDNQVSSLSQSKVTNLTTDLAAKEVTANKGAASGYAPLNSSSQVPIANIPTGTTSTTVALGNHTHAALMGIYPLSAYGFFTASCPIESATTTSEFTNAFFARIFVPAGKAIAAVGMMVTTAGTLAGGGENSFAVYTDAGVFVSSTPTDNTLWSSTGWRVKEFSSAIAAQSSDRFVYVSPLLNGHSANPHIAYNLTRDIVTQGGGYNTNNRRTFYQNGLTAWPASFTPSSYGNNGIGYIPLLGLG